LSFVVKLCSYLRTSLNNRLREALHLFQLRAALQQQQIDSGRLELGDAFGDLLRRDD